MAADLLGGTVLGGCGFGGRMGAGGGADDAAMMGEAPMGTDEPSHAAPKLPCGSATSE